MSKNGASATSASPPAGTGFVTGLGESFSLDLNSGQSTFTLDFDLPDGFAGFKPRVRLEYSLSAGNGPFGLGWRLMQREITRRLDLGTPSQEAAECLRDGSVELRTRGDGTFVPVRDMAFSRYTRSGDGWKIEEKDGRCYFLGLSGAARLADPDHPERVIAWRLEREEDSNSNALVYGYTLIDGYSYLTSITYATYVVRFHYEVRPDPVLSGRAGFEQTITHRCVEISLELAEDGEIVRRQRLSYQPNGPSGTSVLTSSRLSAHRTGLPDVVKNPITFAYEPFDPSAIQIELIETEEGGTLPPSLDDPDVALVSIDDLPLPGILSNRNGSVTYWANRGDGTWARPRSLGDMPHLRGFASEGVQFLDMEGNGQSDLLVGVGGNPLNGYYRNAGNGTFGEFVAYPRTARNVPPFATGRVRLGDLDGDGAVDVLQSAGRGLVSYRNARQDGWSDPSISPNADNINLADPLSFLADMTGDGMPDLVRVRSGDVSYQPNLGHGRFGARRRMAASPRLDGIHRTPDQILLIDVDGSGCSDLVRVSARGVELYVNQGGAGFVAAHQHDVIPVPIPGTVRAVDLYGRGTPGLLYATRRGRSTIYAYFSWSQPSRAHALKRIDNGIGGISEIEIAPMIDMATRDRAEGRLWSTTMPFAIWVVAATQFTDQVRGTTDRVEYRYHDGHFDTRFRRFMGFGEVEQVEKGDASREDVLTRYRFLMDQGTVPGNTRNHAHLDRLLSSVEVFSLDGGPMQDLPLRREETDYGMRVLETLPDGTDRVFTFVSASRKIYMDRGADARIEERRFDYDASGNVTKEQMRGHGQKGGAAVNELLLTTEIDYATNPAGTRFAMSATRKRDAGGNLLMEMRRHYDGLPLGEIAAGNCTREEHCVMRRGDFLAHYAGMSMTDLGLFEQLDGDGTPAVFALEYIRSYTAKGAVAREETGGGRVTVNTYDADGLHLVAEQVAGKTATRDPDPLTGKPRNLTSASGAQVRMQYDAFGRMTHYLVDNDTLATATRIMTYDDVSVPPGMEVSLRVDAATRARTATYYDGRGKEVQKRVERGPGEVVVSPWIVRNPWGDAFQEYEPTLDAGLAFGTPALAGRTFREVSYDGMGRPFSTLNHNGSVSRAEYSPFQYKFWNANDVDPGHADFDTPRVEEVDAWNRRIAIVDDGGSGNTVRTEFDIGLFGEIRAIRDDAGRVAAHDYDLRGNRIRIDHRDAKERLQYFDSHGEIVRTKDAKGNDVDVTRDADGRVTHVRLGGNVVEQFTYDDTDPGADGRLRRADYPGGHQTFSYAARGFLTAHVTHVGGRDFALGYTSDDMGRRKSTIYPDGSAAHQTHSLNGLVVRIEGIVDSISYDARNLPIDVRYSNGVTTHFEYEPGIGHLKRQRTVGPGGAVIEDVAYSYDALMQLIAKTDSAPGGESTTYNHDPLGQITEVNVSGAAGNASQHHYTHVRGYNLANIGDTDWQLDYNDPLSPDRVSDITRPGEAALAVGYDANGNMDAVPGLTCTYNFKNQLVQVVKQDGSQVAYEYDYRGNRVRRVVSVGGNTTETVYIGRLAEITPTRTTNFIILGGKRVAMRRAGAIRWFHLDPLGSVTAFTDETGTRIAEIAYLPFGVERRRSGSPPLRVFARHDYDDVTGLIYMGHRWYMPQMGRFLTPDPLYLHEPERADDMAVKLRLYTYAGNAPSDNVDPDGLSFWSVFGAIVGVIVGIVAAIVIVAAIATGVGAAILAIAGLIALVTVSYAVAHANQGTAVGEFFRGFMIGLNAGLNATFLAMMGPVGAFLGGFVGTMIFLGAFDTIAGLEVYQGIIGWSNWLMPMSWLVVGAGAIMWLLNGLGHLIFWSIPSLWGGGLQFFRIDGFRMDWSTGMLATRGGWVANLNAIDTAYNMGNFAYVDTNSAGWHMDHEAGHNLNLAVYGSIFHFVGFIHEMGTSAGAGAFSEVLAESNDGGPGMWS